MAAETVTVVFTDLVGSTALLSRVGDVTAEALRREHFAILREAVEACGGREVKNLGDGIMAVYDSAADAVASAVAMQRGFERRNRRAAEPLELRVGVAAGDADADDGDYFGVPVVQAARLCAAAAGGEVLSTDVVGMLAGSRAGVAFDPIGELDLKGLDHPVGTVRVRWEPEPQAEVPALPTRLAASLRPAFAGRMQEQEVLASAWKAASVEAEPRIVLLSGEPGIGKTTLAARFAQGAHGAGAAVAYGRCDEDLGIPYQPWIEALGSVVDAASDAVLADHLGAAGTDLARLVPALAARTGAAPPAVSDADGDRLTLFACVVDLLERASEDAPLLLVLDDLHWADRQSLQLLRHLVRAGRSPRVLVLGTFRDSDVSATHPLADLLAALHREHGVDRMALRGLSDADVLDLLEQIAGHDMDDAGVALRDAVLTETAGNPFFVGEILRHLAETGAIYQDAAGRWTGDIDVRTMGLPVSVREVVGRRVAALGPEIEGLLVRAAVIGRDFDVGLLAAIAEVDEDAAIDGCDRAVAASVLVATDDPDRYSFAHALIEHTLYEALSPARRARLHRRVAETIEETTADPAARAAELAYHWGAAVAPADAGRALHYAKLAGDRALEQFAPDEALRWFGDALDLLDRTPGIEPRARAELLVGLGIAQRQVGLAEHRDTLVEAAWLADEHDDVDLLVRAALGNLRGFSSDSGQLAQDRLAVIERALERLGDDDSPARARLLAACAVEGYLDSHVDDRRALAEEAVQVARRCCSEADLVRVLHAAGWALRSPKLLDRRVALLEEAFSMLPRVKDPMLATLVNGELSACALQAGDRQRALRHRDLQFAPSALAAEAWVRWDRDFSEVRWAIIDGSLDEAERLAEEALRTGLDAGQPDAWVIYGAQLTNIRAHQGRLDELVGAVEQALSESPLLAVYRAVLANALACAGRHEEAEALVDAATEGGYAEPEDMNLTTSLASWTGAVVLLQRRSAAPALLRAMEPYASQIPTTTVTFLPAVAHHCGRLDHLLGHHDAADRRFGDAQQVHERFGSPLMHAHNDAAWAALLADRDRGDDRSRARMLAERALAWAEPAGAAGIAADARAVLHRLA